MRVTVDTVLSFFNTQFSQFTAQSRAQRDAGQNTTPAYLSYNSFFTYYAMAEDRLALDLAGYGNMRITEYEATQCLSFLIADMREKSNPDWSYSSQSVDPGDGAPKISITRDTSMTGYMKMYQELLKVAYKKWSLQRVAPFNGTAKEKTDFSRHFMENLYSPTVNFNYWY
jgi:hypothetical protein